MFVIPTFIKLATFSWKVTREKSRQEPDTYRGSSTINNSGRRAGQLATM